MTMTPMERIRKLQETRGFRFTKSLGQNFLTDDNILRKMAQAADLSPEDAVIEIGPGAGVVTDMLLRMTGSVLAVEIDKNLIPFLQETLGHHPHLTLWHQDVLEAPLSDWIREQRQAGFQRVKVVGNLPYYVTTPIVMKLLEEELPVNLMLFMVQKEVARRLSAQPGTKDYSGLTVAVQRYCRAEKIFDVSPRVFVPPPRVDSAVVRLIKHPEPTPVLENPALFFRVVKAAFGQRRKTLLNALSAMPDAGGKERVLQCLNQVAIDPSRRGETLSVEEFAKLAQAFHPKG